jgi:hypothetical protein
VRALAHQFPWADELDVFLGDDEDNEDSSSAGGAYAQRLKCAHELLNESCRYVFKGVGDVFS